MRGEKGSVTLYTLVSMMFFLVILFLAYSGKMNKISAQEKQIAKIQEEYSTENKMEQAYKKVNGEYIQPGGRVSVTYKNNYKDENGDKATIPAGFTVSGVKEESVIGNGLVIYLIPDGQTVNWNNSADVENAKKSYDQFVWVPVPYAIAEDRNADSIVNETDIDLMIAEGKYPMAIAKDTTNYRGILYDFTLSNGKVVVSDKTYNATSENREPSAVTQYDNSSYLAQINGILNTNYTDSTSFANGLQEEFNDMVKKVSDNKGFWVARYETTNMTNTNTEKKVTSIKGITTGINSVTWYRMYAQQRIYSKKANIETKSSMIWGSQWDQIMIWMKEERNNKNTVATNSYYVVNSVGMGNYGVNKDGTTKTTKQLATTGSTEDYKVRNLYDLAGNLHEWTLEANSTNNRARRGGYFGETINPNTSSSYRGLYTPYSTSTWCGSRLTIY